MIVRRGVDGVKLIIDHSVVRHISHAVHRNVETILAEPVSSIYRIFVSHDLHAINDFGDEYAIECGISLVRDRDHDVHVFRCGKRIEIRAVTG